MDWKQEVDEETFAGVWKFYKDRITSNPSKTLAQVEQELQSQWVRLGNDWTGRGIVMDTVITTTINALEVTRAACLEELNKSCMGKCSEKNRKKI